MLTPTIEGYCIVFNQESETIQERGRTFKEVIHKEACTPEFLRNQNITLTLYHDKDKILARHYSGGGNLILTVDDKGVYFKARFLPDTHFPDLDTAIGLIRNGVLHGCSFTYKSKEDDSNAIKYVDNEDGIQRRHIYKMESIQSICIAKNKPAYLGTTCKIVTQPYKIQR